MLGLNTRNRLAYALASPVARDELEALLGAWLNPFGRHWYVDADVVTAGDGLSPANAFDTMAEALSSVGNDDTIHLRGPIFENLTAPNNVTGVTIIGSGSGLAHGSLSNDSEGPAPAWRTASGVTDDPLLILTTQRWVIANILFAAGSADAAIELQTDAGASPEKTLSGTRIIGCRFSAGQYAIHDNGGAGLVTVVGNRFEGQTTASIFNTGGGTLPLMWTIEDNFFGHASATHIDAPLSHSVIRHNTFATVASTAHYIDLTGGANNIVGPGNVLAGTYDHDDYQDATGDVWAGNYTTGGITTANPAA